MTTNNNTSRAAHAAPATEAGLTTLDPGAGYVTTMNTYTVAPERAEEVLDYLVRSAVETVRYVPGFVSMNFHVEPRPDPDRELRPVEKPRGNGSRARKPQNRSAHERDRQDRGQLQADPIRAAAICGGGR